jgi:L-threonylcarbamoyladenylate synthase
MSNVNKAIGVFRKGGIVIFPTDTAFGIGCRIDNEESIKRLFEIRKRPQSQAAPILVDGVSMAKDYLVEFPKSVIAKLVKPYWPGALTIVLPCKKNKVFPLVRGFGDNIGVRMPNNPIILSIIKEVGVPILGPSANFHKDNTPYAFKDLNPDLVSLVDYVLEGECLMGRASTVIDCSKNPWTILRNGALDVKI